MCQTVPVPRAKVSSSETTWTHSGFHEQSWWILMIFDHLRHQNWKYTRFLVAAWRKLDPIIGTSIGIPFLFQNSFFICLNVLLGVSLLESLMLCWWWVKWGKEKGYFVVHESWWARAYAWESWQSRANYSDLPAVNRTQFDAAILSRIL